MNNTKFAEKLACSINQALCPEKEGIEEAKTLNEQSSQGASPVVKQQNIH